MLIKKKIYLYKIQYNNVGIEKHEQHKPVVCSISDRAEINSEIRQYNKQNGNLNKLINQKAAYVDHNSLDLDNILKTNTNKDNFENTHDIVTVMSDDADVVTYANTLNTVVLDFDLVG